MNLEASPEAKHPFITNAEVVLHDPNLDESGIHRHETVAHFRESFESLGSRALLVIVSKLERQNSSQFSDSCLA